jgi:hypothetical protein
MIGSTSRRIIGSALDHSEHRLLAVLRTLKAFVERATHKGRIRFHDFLERLRRRILHRFPDPVAEKPGSLAGTPQITLNLLRAQALPGAFLLYVFRDALTRARQAGNAFRNPYGVVK